MGSWKIRSCPPLHCNCIAMVPVCNIYHAKENFVKLHQKTFSWIIEHIGTKIYVNFSKLWHYVRMWLQFTQKKSKIIWSLLKTLNEVAHQNILTGKWCYWIVFNKDTWHWILKKFKLPFKFLLIFKVWKLGSNDLFFMKMDNRSDNCSTRLPIF